MSKLSSVIEDISRPAVFTASDAFVGACAVVLLLLEALGPILGYPTLTGRLYDLTSVDRDRAVVWQLVLLSVPQVAIAYVGGRALARSPWVRWIAVRASGATRLATPEVHLRETMLGAFAALVVWLLVALQIGLLPGSRSSLVWTEAIILAICLVVALIVVSFKPRTQVQVSDAEDRISWRIPRAAMPTTILLNPTTFLKVIALREAPDGYVVEDARQPLHLDEGELVLLNLGMLEATVSSPVEVKSANLLKCSANLSVAVALPTAGTLYERNAVDYLVNNLYEKPDLLEFLKSQLSLAMDEYSAEFDPVIKGMTEELGLDFLRADSRVAAERAGGVGISAASSADATVEELQAMGMRIASRLRELERYRSALNDARRLQETGKRDLPPAFDRRMRACFGDKMRSRSKETSDSVERLLACSELGVFVHEVELSDTAILAEQSLVSKIESSSTQLNEVEERLSSEKRRQREERTKVIDEKLRAIDPRLLMTARGRRLFEQLVALRAVEWDRMIAEALPEMMSEIDRASPTVPTPARAASPTAGGLRLGRGLEPAGGVGATASPRKAAPPVAPHAAMPPAPSVSPSGTLRIGRTSRTAAPSHPDPASRPLRPGDDSDEPM